MRYLTLSELKKQANIDEAFEADDAFIIMLGDAAEDTAEQLLDADLDEIYAENGEMPAAVQHAMRILFDYFYAVNRGSADNDKDIPEAALMLLKLYRNYH